MFGLSALNGFRYCRSRAHAAVHSSRHAPTPAQHRVPPRARPPDSRDAEIAEIFRRFFGDFGGDGGDRHAGGELLEVLGWRGLPPPPACNKVGGCALAPDGPGSLDPVTASADGIGGVSWVCRWGVEVK